MHIELEQIVKRYGSQTILTEVSLDIPAGDLIAIVGPSGCGKSTLLRILGGFVTVDEGRVYFDAQDVQQIPPERRPTSLVFQDYALWPHKTVFENIAFGLHVRKWPTQAIIDRVREMLALVSLSDMGHRYPSQLSGGQQQRVALARSLAVDPQILLLDEPLSSLDAHMRVQMRSELRSLQQRLGITMIYVTHDQEEALSVADRVVVMNVGYVEQYGTPTEMYHHPVTPFVARFIGKSNILRGQIVAVDNQMLSVELCPTSTPSVSIDQPVISITRTGQALPPTIVPGQEVTIAIKPEHIEWATEPMNEGQWFPAVVTQANFLGAYWQFQLETTSGPLTVSTNTIPMQATRTAFAPLSQLAIKINPSQARVFVDTHSDKDHTSKPDL